MKKLLVGLLSVACLTTMSGCGFISSLMGLLKSKQTYKDRVGEWLGVDLNSTQVLEEWEYRGWFNDGSAFLKLSIPDGFEQELGIGENVDGKVGDGWYVLPLTGMAYEYFYEWSGLFEHPETGERVIPEVENGYWKMSGSGQNWELVIVDSGANILYYYEYDS